MCISGRGEAVTRGNRNYFCLFSLQAICFTKNSHQFNQTTRFTVDVFWLGQPASCVTNHQHCQADWLAATEPDYRFRGNVSRLSPRICIWNAHKDVFIPIKRSLPQLTSHSAANRAFQSAVGERNRTFQFPAVLRPNLVDEVDLVCQN